MSCSRCGSSATCACGCTQRFKGGRSDHSCCKCGHLWDDGLWSTNGESGTPPSLNCNQCGHPRDKHYTPPDTRSWQEKQAAEDRWRANERAERAAQEHWDDLKARSAWARRGGY